MDSAALLLGGIAVLLGALTGWGMKTRMESRKKTKEQRRAIAALKTKATRKKAELEQVAKAATVRREEADRVMQRHDEIVRATEKAIQEMEYTGEVSTATQDYIRNLKNRMQTWGGVLLLSLVASAGPILGQEIEEEAPPQPPTECEAAALELDEHLEACLEGQRKLRYSLDRYEADLRDLNEVRRSCEESLDTTLGIAATGYELAGEIDTAYRDLERARRKGRRWRLVQIAAWAFVGGAVAADLSD